MSWLESRPLTLCMGTRLRNFRHGHWSSVLAHDLNARLVTDRHRRYFSKPVKLEFSARFLLLIAQISSLVLQGGDHKRGLCRLELAPDQFQRVGRVNVVTLRLLELSSCSDFICFCTWSSIKDAMSNWQTTKKRRSVILFSSIQGLKISAFTAWRSLLLLLINIGLSKICWYVTKTLDFPQRILIYLS